MTNHPTIHFTKMHGAGNDYIYVDSSRYHIPDPAAAARLWSDRHTGIGSDGLVLIGQPSIMSGADFSMRIFNADGSEAMMCGNASRCIGKYLYERGLTTKTAIRLETLSGVKTLMLTLSANGRSVESVTVDMLQPTLHCAAQYDEQVGVDALREIGHPLFVSMGNPHCVIFVDDLSRVDIACEGARLERYAAFPQRCNIEFAQLTEPATLRTRVWDRGLRHGRSRRHLRHSPTPEPHRDGWRHTHHRLAGRRPRHAQRTGRLCLRGRHRALTHTRVGADSHQRGQHSYRIL